MKRKDGGSNPYRPPEVGEKIRPVGIGSLRYAANIGCGLGMLMILVPSLVMGIYRRSGELPVFLVVVLLVLGAGHSIWWAHRARKKGTH